MSTYDPPSVMPTWTSINPRPFPSLQQLPENLIFPSLPSAPRQSAFSNLWTLSTHIIPAAYPRVTPDVLPPVKVPDTLIDKNERRRMNSEKATEMLAANIKHSTNPSPDNGNKVVLWNCVNRYVKKGLGGGKGLTLFFAHANGFYKEVCYFLDLPGLSCL